MSEPTEQVFPPSSDSEAPRKADRVVDPKNLVYSGGFNGDPRELLETPGVVPEGLDQAPEDLRPDLFRETDSSEDEPI